jgi:hypothetical protein
MTVVQEFEKLSDRLNAEMLESYSFTSLERNPVLRVARADASLNDILCILNDYCGLPRVIIRLLEKARQKAETANMAEVAEELALNLSEERGKDERAKPFGVPHYEMLLRGLEKEFGFKPSQEVRLPTQSFLKQMDDVIGAPSPAKVTGAVYALESSANPELRVVRQVFEIIANKRGKANRRRLQLGFRIG